jgi:hypothetical protein
MPGHFQTGLVLNMAEQPDQYHTLRDVTRNTILANRALGIHVSGYDSGQNYVKLYCVCVCVYCCSLVCANVLPSPKLCMCFLCILEAVTSMFASPFVCSLLREISHLTPHRPSRLARDHKMMLVYIRWCRYTLRYNIIISSEIIAVVHFRCTSLHIGACACLLAECDQVITRMSHFI